MEIIPGRPDINFRTMLTMLEKAKNNKADVVVFPEMSIPGYLIGDTWEQIAFLKDCEYYGQQIIEASNSLIIMFGNVAVDWNKQNYDGRVRKYNAFYIAQNGKALGNDNFPYPFRIKTLLPNYREFDDNRHFFSLKNLAEELNYNIETLLQPVNLTHKGKKLSIGCILCEDGWSEDYYIKPIRVINEKSRIDMFINISCSPFTLGKNNKRNRVFSKQAKDIGVPIIYVNNVGIQNNGKTIYTFDGHSTVYNNNGDVIFYNSHPFYSEISFIELDLAYGGTNYPVVDVPNDNNIKYIHQSLTYGVKKFIELTGIKKVVIGISGGIDSAVSAALYANALGSENVLLVNMPSRYNSETTKNLAATLAKNLQCLYTVLPIQHVVDYTIEQIESAEIINPVDNSKHNLQVSSFMSENIQARDRSARILAALAAAFGGVFTCNANKTELTVGYSTQYGDQAGFLAALADLWKYQVYDLARYYNDVIYNREVIPQGIIDIVPSAELSFEQSVDKGKGDPIIYKYHDYLFKSFVEKWDRATPEEILEWYTQGVLDEKLGCTPGLVRQTFPGAPEFIQDLERWWNLFNGMGLAKRIQAPPVLAVSRRAFGFDYRESQNGVYYTHQYQMLKKDLLNSHKLFK